MSVVGGWRSQIVDGELFGPTFNNIKDLWAWQKENLPDNNIDINDNWYDEQFELDTELEF